MTNLIESLEYNGKHVKVLRLDKFKTQTGKGVKSYLAEQYAQENPQGVVTCGSRDSIQVLSFSKTLTKLDIPCHVFIPNGKDTPMIKELEKTNAIIHRVRPGYASVLNARAREFSKENKLKYVPLGMKENLAYDHIAQLLNDYTNDIENANRIVAVIGSGTSIIGLSKKIIDIDYNKEIVGVEVGMDSSKHINQNLPIDTITIKKSNLKYNQKVKNDYGFNETYEAKCLEFLQDNDLFIVIDK